MANVWQFKSGDKVHGPFTDSQLDQLIRSGRVDPDTPVRPSDNSIWRKAGETDGLFGNVRHEAVVVEVDADAIMDEVLFGKPPRMASSEPGVDTLYSEDLSHGQNYGGVTAVNPFLDEGLAS